MGKEGDANTELLQEQGMRAMAPTKLLQKFPDLKNNRQSQEAVWFLLQSPEIATFTNSSDSSGFSAVRGNCDSPFDNALQACILKCLPKTFDSVHKSLSCLPVRLPITRLSHRRCKRDQESGTLHGY